MVEDIGSAQAGNVKISYMMKEKQLEVHPDKTGFIVMGGKEYKKQVFEELQEAPIMFGNIHTKCKDVDKYLGDMIHTDGLAASVAATVKDRTGKVKAAMYKAAAIIEDYRMQAVGGLMGAWDLWNMAIIPSLLNNSGVWTEIDEKTVLVL